MKKFLMWLMLLAFPALAQILSSDLDRRVTTTVVVKDEKDEPVADADVRITYRQFRAGKYDTGRGTSDASGRYSHTGTALDRVTAEAQKDGYYTTNARKEVLVYDEDGQPSYINPELVLVLKRIIDPVPMYARKDTAILPKGVLEGGFDLTAADWVAPIGAGKNADIVFSIASRFEGYNDYESTLEISFPNEGDGLIPFYANESDGSMLRSPQLAPLGGYQPFRSITRARSTRINERGEEQVESVDESEENINYLIRVRTVLDERGEIVSCRYGKVYGEFEFGGEISDEGFYVKIGARAYYLNSSDNDRRMEFDQKSNLFQNLGSLEKPQLP